MAAISHNHAGYQARLELIREEILVEHLGLSDGDLERTTCEPIQYDAECPFKYNNFIYSITLPRLLASPEERRRGEQQRQPGCVAMPAGTSSLIVRISNPDAEGMHRATRVENEVAILSLAAAALQHVEPAVVPRVFAWRSAAGSLGWILQERMRGEPVDEAFGAMSREQKRGILAQMAEMLKALQDYRLPDSITGWGGVTFDRGGRLVSAAMSSVGSGPWNSLEDSYRGRLRAALEEADANPHIQGWHANGVRERLEAFVERGLPAQFAPLVSKLDRTIVHADFTTNNLLYDPSSGRITALLDYDFSSILHPAYEFFRSFHRTGDRFRSESEDETAEDAALRKAKLSGHFPSSLPASSGSSEGIQWDVAKAWEDELARLQVKRPSTIPGVDKVADVDAMLRAILPWHVNSSDFLRMQPEGAVSHFRQRGEEQLVTVLEHVGF